MDQAPQNVQCGNCQGPIDEPTDLPAENRKPCPSCGSTIRRINVRVSDTLTCHESLGLKLKDSTGKSLSESLGGDDLHRKSGKWMHKTRIIDHKGDRYKEVVTDPLIGDLVHECDEPLSRHRGHGSDNKRER